MKRMMFDAELARRNLGWRPDVPDARDLHFKDRRRQLMRGIGRKTEYLRQVDLRSGCSRVEDQEALGSCTAQAVAGDLEFLMKGRMEVSRLYIYYYERKMIGTIPYDSGAYIRDGIKVAAKGFCREELWPYEISKYRRRPHRAARRDAELRRAGTYSRCDTLDDVKASLGMGLPVVFGFSVYDFALEADVAKTGFIRMPTTSDRLEGGHAVMAVGYDDDRQAILFRNSWGEGWGMKGYGWLPYGYFLTRDLTDDMWEIDNVVEGESA